MINFDDISDYPTWDLIYYFELEISTGIEALKKLNINQETSLNQTRQEFKAKLEKLEEEFGEDREYFNHLYWQNLEPELDVIDSIKRLQTYSLFLSIFAFIEERLLFICEAIKEKYNDISRYSKNKGYIQKYLDYLSNTYKVDISTVYEYYDIINNLRPVRNIIAHNGGEISDNNMGKIKRGIGLKSTKIRNSNYLYLDPLFIEWFLKIVGNFFEKLCIAIDTRYAHLKGENNLSL